MARASVLLDQYPDWVRAGENPGKVRLVYDVIGTRDPLPGDRVVVGEGLYRHERGVVTAQDDGYDGPLKVAVLVDWGEPDE